MYGGDALNDLSGKRSAALLLCLLCRLCLLSLLLKHLFIAQLLYVGLFKFPAGKVDDLLFVSQHCCRLVFGNHRDDAGNGLIFIGGFIELIIIPRPVAFINNLTCRVQNFVDQI